MGYTPSSNSESSTCLFRRQDKGSARVTWAGQARLAVADPAYKRPGRWPNISICVSDLVSRSKVVYNNLNEFFKFDTLK